MTAPEDVLKALNAANAAWPVKLEDGALWVERQALLEICAWLKDNTLQLDYLANLTAVDYPPEHIVMVYHFFSMCRQDGPVLLKVRLQRQDPVVDSLTPLWRGAEYQEREVYDLYGVVFDGHPDLRRILMWDEFEGFPMRKDYVAEDQDVNES